MTFYNCSSRPQAWKICRIPLSESKNKAMLGRTVEKFKRLFPLSVLLLAKRFSHLPNMKVTPRRAEDHMGWGHITAIISMQTQ